MDNLFCYIKNRKKNMTHIWNPVDRLVVLLVVTPRLFIYVRMRWLERMKVNNSNLITSDCDLYGLLHLSNYCWWSFCLWNLEYHEKGMWVKKFVKAKSEPGSGQAWKCSHGSRMRYVADVYRKKEETHSPTTSSFLPSTHTLDDLPAAVPFVSIAAFLR